MAKILQECIIVSKEVNDKFILAKNRDRAYNPSLEIIHRLPSLSVNLFPSLWK